MNIIFCTSPFQVLIAREVAKATGEKFFGIYLKMSNDNRQKIYAEKMKEVCEDTLFIDNKEWASKLREKLANIKIDKFYLASLDNPVAHMIFNPNFMRLFTFDDGSTSIISPNMYTRYTDRVVGPKDITLENVIDLMDITQYLTLIPYSQLKN